MSSLIYEPETSNILLGSRKINFWFFKTQEESKTSHDAPVAFAMYNTQFENVVSGSDDGFIAVWDVENGRQITKFGDTHGKGAKLTAACFDSTQRRMVTAGSDGTVKIWNFSNGSSLKNLVINEKEKKFSVDKEVTSLVCAYEPENDEKPSYFVASGWDRRLRIWHDDRENENEYFDVGKDLPTTKTTNNLDFHGDDIMSAIYDHHTNQVFTGGHDGTILAWNFETGFVKFYLHTKDKTCKSEKWIKDAKSVDCMYIMQDEEKVKGTEYVHILVTGTADQRLRFWDLRDMSSNDYFLGSMHVGHNEEDALTAFCFNEDRTALVTADSKGRIMLRDVSETNWLKDGANYAATMK